MSSICCLRAAALVSVLALAPHAFADDGRFIVKFHPGSGPAVKGAVHVAGGRILTELGPQNALAALLPPEALAALRANPNVEYVENDPRRYPLAQTTPYGIRMVQADQVGDANAGSRNVCIIDSGYSRDHEDLDSDSSVTGDNDSGTGNWFEDGCGHGTHVAGTISALNNDRGVLGVLPNGNINLHIVKVFGNDCSWSYSSDLIAALNECRNDGANVVSMSLGCTGRFCRSTTEENAFNDAYSAGVLSIAAAGNSGNTQVSYPAGYASVVSVAAIDSGKVVASFSQQNSDVELAAPGVAVRSTVPMGTGTEESLTVDAAGYEAVGMDGSPDATGTGPLLDCGLGTSPCPGGGGQVCLIQRGDISFADKVLNCEAGSGSAAVIYNNADSLFSGTLGTTATSIPSVGISGVDGNFLKTNNLGASSTVVTGPGNYAFFDGTSMATPHVSGVAALVWSYGPTWSNDQVRTALQATAEDLGAAGRDNAYGYGLVQAKAAVCHLDSSLALCGGDGNNPPTASFTFTCTDLFCAFDGSGSTDGDGTITNYAWDFGDGTTDSGATVDHTYAAGGTYTVTLTVTDDDGATDGDSKNVTVSSATTNNPPTASFTFTCSDLTCDFDGSGSTDGDGTIASYTWDFGDGTTDTGATVNHTYAAGGTYSVTLTVTDDDGATDSDLQSVSVSSSSAGISLSVTGYKERGLQKADLTWNGATSTNVDIYRNGVVIATTGNDGFHTDNINARGRGTYSYKVCEAGTSTCSDEVTITFN